MTERIHRKEASQPTAAPAAPVRVADQSLVLGLQRKAGNAATTALLARKAKVPPAPPTGVKLPSGLQEKLEKSGIPLGDVRVFFNDPEAAVVAAGAFTRGSEIHLGPGSKRLPHEAWHIVQQRGGKLPEKEEEASETESDEGADLATTFHVADGAYVSDLAPAWVAKAAPPPPPPEPVGPAVVPPPPEAEAQHVPPGQAGNAPVPPPA